MLLCPNCQSEIPPEEAKIYAEVLVCPKCYDTATAYYEYNKKTLEQILVFLKDSIRVQLLERRLANWSADKAADKKAVLESIVALQRNQDGPTKT